MRLLCIVAALAVLVTGCGFVGDGVNVIRGVQLPPGKLYQPEFYKTASPEDVKQAIAGRSLKDESYTGRHFSNAYTSQGRYAPIVLMIAPFFPLSEVREDTPIYPLQVAAAYTPYPEVISIILNAGLANAGIEVQRQTVFAAIAEQKNNNVTKVLLKHFPAWAQIALSAFAAQGNREMVEFCLSQPGVDIHDDRGPNAPFVVALEKGHTSLAAYLLERGASLPKSPSVQYDLMRDLLNSNSVEGFWMVVKLGLDCSQKNFSGKNDFFSAAREGKVTDKAVIRHLADKVPVDNENGVSALRNACVMESADAVKRLLARGALPKDSSRQQDVLVALLEFNMSEGFWLVANSGVDCSRFHKLMHAAYRGKVTDNGIIRYLVDRVPVDGMNGAEAVQAACKMENVAAVKGLLARGAAPAEYARYVEIRKASPYAEQLKAMVREKGFKVTEVENYAY